MKQTSSEGLQKAGERSKVGRRLTLTEKGGPFIWVGGPAAGHEVNEGLSAGDVCWQTVQARVGSRSAENTEHDLHGIGGLCSQREQEDSVRGLRNVAWKDRLLQLKKWRRKCP